MNKNTSNFLDDETYRQMVKLISRYEIRIFQSRVDRVEKRMERYFNSTPLKNVFAGVCNYAFYVNKFYTIAMLKES